MSDPITTFIENTDEVKKLLKAHETITGVKPGRRYDIEVINKSSVVLLTACWEAFVEDAAAGAFDFLISKSKDPHKIPEAIRRNVAIWNRKNEHELREWFFAGEGWRSVLQNYKKHHVGLFNTPRAGKVDELFRDLLGLSSVSDNWKWPGMKPQKARDRLSDYITLRGSIAHRVKAGKSVGKHTAVDYLVFVSRLAVRTSNVTNKYILNLVGEAPWGPYNYGSFR